MIFAVFFCLSLLALLLYTFWVGRQKGGRPGHEPLGKDMKPYLLWGVFYVNPDDPRSWPPKVIPSLGWTVNFRVAQRAYIFALLLVLVLVSSLLFSWYGVSQFLHTI